MEEELERRAQEVHQKAAEADDRGSPSFSGREPSNASTDIPGLVDSDSDAAAPSSTLSEQHRGDDSEPSRAHVRQ